MKSKSLFICALVTSFASGSAFAADHGCGPRPSSPEMFDPQTADRAQVMENKAAFESYQAANTAYLDCIEAYAKSDAFAAQPQDDVNSQTAELNREMQAVMAEEQSYADSFNANAKTWVEVQRAAKEEATAETEDPNL